MSCFIFKFIIVVGLVSSLFVEVKSQIGFTNLTKIGVIKARNYALKITGSSTYQLMVIKLVPNVGNLSNCGIDVVNSYKATLTRLLTPINNALLAMKNVISNKDNNLRLWGAIVGGVALGVATSAQITAGVALHNSIENANAIANIKQAILTTNHAVAELNAGLSQTVLAINALQDQINTNLVPALNNLGCSTVANSLGLKLNQYLSELITVFGPNLRDPAVETLSIQAIAHAFNGDFDTLLKNFGYSDEDFLDILESDSIRGRIIDVSLDGYYIVLQIEYPSLITVANAAVQKFNLISYNEQSSEWITVFPPQILKRGSYLSNIDLTGCTETTNSQVCSHDMSYPLGTQMYACATGDIQQCARTRVVNSHVSRYALSDGVLFANCYFINCRCVNPNFNILQDNGVTTVMFSSEYCKEVLIDNMFITVGPSTLNRVMFSANVSVGGVVSVDPVDVGSEIADIQDTINKVEDKLDQSNSILDKVNPKVVNTQGFVAIWVILVILILFVIAFLIWLIWITRVIHMGDSYMRTLSRSPTMTTLSTVSGSYQN